MESVARMGRKGPIYPSKAARLAAQSSSAVPPELRGQLESTRLDLLALFRALDRMRLAQDVPPELRALGELDADFAEALWALDQPPGRFDFAVMVRDTTAYYGVVETNAEVQALLRDIRANPRRYINLTIF